MAKKKKKIMAMTKGHQEHDDAVRQNTHFCKLELRAAKINK